MAQPHRNLVKTMFHCQLPADSGSHDSQRRSQCTRERGNGNQGHTYGVDLSSTDKNALLEYLKTQ